MGFFFGFLFIVLVLYCCIKIGIEQETRDAEAEAKRIKAIRDGESSYISHWNKLGAVLVDVNTGERYVRMSVGSHVCHFTPNGKLIRDITQEQLDRELKNEEQCAAREGRRLYVVDNRMYTSETFNPGTKLSYKITGVRVKDSLTGKVYIVRSVQLHDKLSKESESVYCPILVDPNTLIVYDVVKQDRGYMQWESGRGYFTTVFDTAVRLHNWWAVNNKQALIRNGINTCALGYDLGIGITNDMLRDIDIRPEFKEMKEFPVEIPSETPNYEWNVWSHYRLPIYCSEDDSCGRYTNR